MLLKEKKNSGGGISYFTVSLRKFSYILSLRKKKRQNDCLLSYEIKKNIAEFSRVSKKKNSSFFHSFIHSFWNIS